MWPENIATMPVAYEYILLVVSLILLIGILATKLSSNLGVPSLVLFIFVGMVAGSEGAIGIPFDDFELARSIGILALIVILYAGGVDTNWSDVRPLFIPAAILSTVGVFLTAAAVGIFSVYVLNFTWLEGLLLGSIISSTDAAAVFSVLRAKGLNLTGNVKPLLELESGSNDPMAVFLTISVIQLMTVESSSAMTTVLFFFQQMLIGGLIGYVLGKGIVLLINRLKLMYEGLYPVLSLSLAIFTFSIATVLTGNGFLAVYVAGLVLGSSPFAYRKTLIRFHDGLAWLMQIVMFVTLGLLVFPSHLVEVIGMGLLVSAFLVFVARPASIFAGLLPFRLSFREKSFVAWVGLRGAVPIILATFPLIAGIPNAEYIFNLVFFVVLTSALVQGASISFVAKFFGLLEPTRKTSPYRLEFDAAHDTETDVVELMVPYNSPVVGKSIVELNLPEGVLIVLLSKNGELISPSGGTVLDAGDDMFVLVTRKTLPAVKRILAGGER
jgi:potassium/hydrogen antiporter